MSQQKEIWVSTEVIHVPRMPRTLESWIEGPRWIGLPVHLRKAAQEEGLICKITHVEKGWIRETVFFEITGHDRCLQNFVVRYRDGIHDYNFK